MTKNSLSKAHRIWLWLNLVLLLLFVCFVYFKTKGLGDQGWLSYPWIAVFFVVCIMLIAIWIVIFNSLQENVHESYRDDISGSIPGSQKTLSCPSVSQRDGLSDSIPDSHKTISRSRESHRDDILDSTPDPLKTISSPSGTAYQTGTTSQQKRIVTPSRRYPISQLSISKLWYLLILIIYVILIFAYDFSVAEAWIDAKGDVQTAQLLHKQGLGSFLKTYHHQSAYDILHNEAGKKGIEKYARLLPFYPLKERLQEMDLPHDKLENNRRQHHPPSFFMLLATWIGIDDSLISLKIFSKVMLLLYLLSIWLVLRRIIKDDWLRLGSLLVIGLMPALLMASQTPRNDLLLGIISALIVMVLLDIAKSSITPWWKHCLLGVLCFLAIFSKFTALLLALPILGIYFYRFRLRAFHYLLWVALPILVIPVLLYFVSGYDMLLNIITGRVLQDVWVAENIGSIEFLLHRVLFGQFRVGIPVMLLAAFALPSLLIKKEQMATLILFIFYLSTFLLLWGSSVDRHQIGFLPFAIPVIAYAFKRFSRLLPSVLLLLLLYNLCFVFYAISDNSHDQQHVIEIHHK